MTQDREIIPCEIHQTITRAQAEEWFRHNLESEAEPNHRITSIFVAIERTETMPAQVLFKYRNENYHIAIYSDVKLVCRARKNQLEKDCRSFPSLFAFIKECAERAEGLAENEVIDGISFYQSNNRLLVKL